MGKDSQLVPRDFAAAVKDIKLAILQARAKAARLANAEALKLYFFVGGYISKKTRKAKWGSGAIDALSNQLQVELPGLRGFSPTSMKKMRLFFEAWSSYLSIRPLATDELSRTSIRHLPSVEIQQSPTVEIVDDFCFMGREKRLLVEDEEFFIDLLFYHRGLRALVAIELKMGKFRPGYIGQLNFYLSALDKLVKREDENPSIGLLLCEEMKKPVVQLAVQDVSKPIGVSTYKTLKTIPQPYRTLAPVIEGVKRVMAQNAKGGRK